MLIKVTKEDIRESKKLIKSGKYTSLVDCCPICLSAKKAFNSQVFVYSHQLYVVKSKIMYDLPKVAIDFIGEFNSRADGREIEFQLPIDNR